MHTFLFRGEEAEKNKIVFLAAHMLRVLTKMCAILFLFRASAGSRVCPTDISYTCIAYYFIIVVVVVVITIFIYDLVISIFVIAAVAHVQM